MKKWYNGFRFSTEVETTLYNPVPDFRTEPMAVPSGWSVFRSTQRPGVLLTAPQSLCDGTSYAKNLFNKLFFTAAVIV